MNEGEILITGGAGFLGAELAKELLKSNPGLSLHLTDLAYHSRLDEIKTKVQFTKADLSDPSICHTLVNAKTVAVFHLASLVSGGAEKNFEAGLHANLLAPLHLLEICRKCGTSPKFIFPSSIATFGGNNMPSVIEDYTHQHPQNSYGAHKAAIEQVLNDYSRKGFIDGRGIRLAAIVVRDEPNTAVSGYASALIREPLAGRDYVCPVPADTCLPILSLKKCVEALIKLSQVAGDELGSFRTVNSPCVSPSARQIANAVEQLDRQGRGSICFEPNPEVASIVSSWPRNMEFNRAKNLDLLPDESIETIIEEYISYQKITRLK